MTCEEARLQMMEAFVSSPSDQLAAHVADCAACRGEWEDLQAGFASLPAPTKAHVPPALRESVRRAILADLAPRPARRVAGMPLDAVLSVVFGSAASFASLFLLHARGMLDGIGPLAVAGGAVAWAGLFTLAFWTLLRRWDSDPQLGHLVLGSLSAAGLFLIGNHLLPLPHVVQWCSTRLGAGLGPLFFGLGALYAAVPLVLFSIRSSRWRPRPRRALLAGGCFFFLVAPAIFLQCAFFTVGALLAWLLGALAGSAVGSAASYLFANRSPP
jgi:hypothetical protein